MEYLSQIKTYFQRIENFKWQDKIALVGCIAIIYKSEKLVADYSNTCTYFSASAYIPKTVVQGARIAIITLCVAKIFAYPYLFLTAAVTAIFITTIFGPSSSLPTSPNSQSPTVFRWDNPVDKLNAMLQTSSREWIYTTQDHNFAMTNGPFSKFCIFFTDSFTGFSMAARTQDAIEKVLKDAIKPKDSLADALEDIRKYQKTVDLLNTVRTLWNTQITNIPQITLPPLDGEIKSHNAIYRILPQAEQKKWAPYENRECTSVANWISSAEFLMNDAKTWMPTAQVYASFNVPWSYEFDFWKITPKKHTFKMAGDYEQELEYLEVYFKAADFKKTWKQSQADLTGENRALDLLCSFFQRQQEWQRKPVTIIFPTNVFWNAGGFSVYLRNIAQLMNQKMKDNSACFVHRTALYAEVYLDESQKDSAGVCLSRVVHGKDCYISPPAPRPELKGLINEIPQRGFSQDVLQQHRCEIALMQKADTHNFSLRLEGKERGCNKEVLLEAYPQLRAQERFKEHPNQLNLDALQVNIHPQHVEWVLDELLIFAYCRQHPTLRKQQSKETQEAFVSYQALLDFLRPGSVYIEAQ